MLIIKSIFPNLSSLFKFFIIISNLKFFPIKHNSTCCEIPEHYYNGCYNFRPDVVYISIVYKCV